MKIILIRHGETIESRKRIILGHLPGFLTQKGKQNTKHIANTIILKKLNPSKIYSSDLNRAKQSAMIISKALKINVSYNELLRERSAGMVEGVNEDKINWEEYEKNAYAERKHEGGESFKDVHKRARRFLGSLDTDSKETIIVVSHSVLLAMILVVIKKWGLQKRCKYSFDEAISIVDLKTKRVERIPLS